MLISSSSLRVKRAAMIANCIASWGIKMEVFSQDCRPCHKVNVFFVMVHGVLHMVEIASVDKKLKFSLCLTILSFFSPYSACSCVLYLHGGYYPTWQTASSYGGGIPHLVPWWYMNNMGHIAICQFSNLAFHEENNSKIILFIMFILTVSSLFFLRCTQLELHKQIRKKIIGC